MTLPGTVVIKSTSDLTPAGILGYAKFIAAALVPILAVIVQYLPEDDGTGNEWKRWTQLAITVLGAVAVLAAPNAVKPVEVPPPAVNVEPSADPVVPPGPAPIPPAVLEEPPVADPDPILGVIDPPGRHEQP